MLAAGAATLLLLAGAPSAMAAKSTFGGSIKPNRGPVGTPLKLTLRFTLDPEPGPNPATLRRVEMRFPPNARVNNRLFPTCAPELINRYLNTKRCPKLSRIGRGVGRADTPNADVYNVPVRFTFFNGPRGGIVIFVQAENPVVINEAFEARLIRTRGRYGYRLIANVPPTLQVINDAPITDPTAWFVGLRRFQSTVGITRKVRGKTRGFIEARTRCPRSRRVPIRASFDFLQSVHRRTSSAGWIRCRP